MVGVPAGQVGELGRALGECDGDAGGGDRPGGAGDVAAPEGTVVLYLHGRGAAVERSEVHRLHAGGEVAGALAGHRPGGQRLGRQELKVQQLGLDQLPVVAAEERVRAEDLEEQRLPGQADHHAALALQRVGRVRGAEPVPFLLVVLEPVHVLEEGAGGGGAAGGVEAADPFPNAVLPVATPLPVHTAGKLGPHVQRRAPRLPAVAVLSRFPAAGLDAEGVDVAAFARAEDDVAGAGPVLLAAFEQLPFQQQCGARAVVGNGKAGHLGTAGEFGDGDVGVCAGADAKASGAGGPDGEDAERAEAAAGADVELGNFHENLLVIYRISALIGSSMHVLLL